MDKIKCARCGYSEFSSSLHIHHIDLNHDNNNPLNIIVLCSNCHFGVHHNKWSIEEMGYHSTNKIKNVKKRKPGLKIANVKLRDEIKNLNNEIIDLNNEITILVSSIKDMKRSTYHNLELHSIEKKVLYDYIRLNSLTLYEDMMLIESVINSIRYRVHTKPTIKTHYIPKDLAKLFKKYYSKIKSHEIGYIKYKSCDFDIDTITLIQHYATPSTAEMSEVAELKPVI